MTKEILNESSNDIMVSEQHSIGKSIILHLLPGLLVVLFYMITAPIAVKSGFPSLFALLIGILVIIVPFELGLLFYEGKKKNGRFSLKGIVLNREKMPVWQYFIFVLVIVAVGDVGLSLVSRMLDGIIIEKFFAWVPKWFYITDFINNVSHYSKTSLIITWILGVLLSGIVGPVVEEMYFRGYLLPRISRLGGWAPFISTLLFSLYHFHTPWQNIDRIISLLPLTYSVWWKRNIYISMIAHCIMNVAGMVGLITIIFR